MVQNEIMEKRIMESWYKIHKVITAVTFRKKCYLVLSWQPLPQRLITCQLDTDLDNQKNRKIGTLVKFQFLVLDSLKHSNKAESSINKFAKTVISRNLTTSWKNRLLFLQFLFSVFNLQALEFYLRNNNNRS